MAQTKKPVNPAWLSALLTAGLLVIAVIGAWICGMFDQGCKINKPCTMNMGSYKQPVLLVKHEDSSATTVIIDGKEAPVVTVPTSQTDVKDH